MENEEQVRKEFDTLLDEVLDMVKVFHGMFERTADGRIRLLLAATMLAKKVAASEGIPPQVLADMVPPLVRGWIEAGRPEEFHLVAAPGESALGQALLRALHDKGLAEDGVHIRKIEREDPDAN